MSLVLLPNGPGTIVELRDGEQGLPVAPRGTIAILGRFSSGPVLFAALAMTRSSARLISGDPDDDLEASACLNDAYFFAEPPVLIGRVTDGLEVQSRMSLWDRNPSRSFFHRTAQTDRAPLATGLAHNGGSWGGRRKILLGSGTITSIITGISTFTTGLTMLVDRYKDGVLYVESDDSGTSYTISGNTTSGVITIDGEFSTTAQGLTGTKKYQIVLSGGKELSIVIGQDGEVGARFSLRADRKFDEDLPWEVVSAYESLDLNASDDRPWTTMISDGEENGGRYQIALSTSYDGATVERKLPSNFSEVPTLVSGPTLTYQWYRWSAESGNTGNPYLDSISVINADLVEPHVYTLTFTAATTATVTVTFVDGATFELGTLTLGTLFNPAHPQLTSFTCKAGGTAAVSGDIISIRVNTLPLDLSQRDSYLYPVAVSTDGNPGVRLKVASSTYNSVTVRSDIDLSDYDSTAMAAASVTGTADMSAVSLTAGETVILTVDGLSAITLTSAGSGPGAAAIAVELEALDTAGIFTFTASGTSLKIALTKSLGSGSSLLIGNGTANAKIGITNGNEYTGTDGVPFRIEGRFPMWGGYDGGAPSASRYILALDGDQHLFRRHMCQNLGLVRMATPGVTAAAVKTAADALVSAHGWMYTAEFASSLHSGQTPGEAAVSDMTSNDAQSDYVERYFPSQGKFLNTGRTRLVTRSLSGAILGLRAKLASTGVDSERGMHIAAANNNLQGRLSPLVKGLPDEIGRWSPPIGFMDSNGIVPVLWEGQDVFLYGNRMYSRGRTPSGRRYTITERAVFYHIARDLFVTTRPFIFKSLSVRRLTDILVSLRAKLRPYHQDGWFADVNGTSFNDQVQVNVPPDMNSSADLLEGMVTATVAFAPRPSIEVLHLIISPTNLTAE